MVPKKVVWRCQKWKIYFIFIFDVFTRNLTYFDQCAIYLVLIVQIHTFGPKYKRWHAKPGTYRSQKTNILGVKIPHKIKVVCFCAYTQFDVFWSMCNLSDCPNSYFRAKIWTLTCRTWYRSQKTHILWVKIPSEM